VTPTHPEHPDRTRESSRACAALAGELRRRLPDIPAGYEDGFDALADTIAEIEACSRTDAADTVRSLIDAGWLRYAAAGRGIGVSAPWLYERPSLVAQPS
jgi:hypothetical protein